MSAHRIETLEHLRQHYPEPGKMVSNKTLDHIDVHGRSLIAVSPFVLIGTVDAEGRMDVSPKGDAPGFVAVLDDKRLAIPDRPGNKLLEGYENVIANPRVGLLFLIPALRENYRVNGAASISVDPELCARLSAGGKPALSALIVDVEEAFMHCGKAAIRSGLWEAEKFPDLSHLPSAGKMIADQTRMQPREVEEDLVETYANTLY